MTLEYERFKGGGGLRSSAAVDESPCSEDVDAAFAKRCCAIPEEAGIVDTRAYENESGESVMPRSLPS